MTMYNGTVMPNWDQYVDLLLYAALSCHWQGNDSGALGYYNNATKMWNETSRGLQDDATKGKYAIYKLALLLYTSKVLGKNLTFESELVERIYGQQRESDGGIITDYYANGTSEGDANTETTSIIIIALLTPPKPSLGTFAFYYPWYGTPSVSGYWNHWNGNGTDHNPDNITKGRRDIAATDYPLNDVYDSNNETVIDKQIKEAKDAGINCFVISWWGMDSFTDNASKHIKNVCEQGDFKFTFYLENTSEYYNDTPSIDQTVNDITYLLNTYGNSSSFYKIDGWPVIFVYKQARDALNPNEWNLYFNGMNQPVSSAGYFRLSEDVRSPSRY